MSAPSPVSELRWLGYAGLWISLLALTYVFAVRFVNLLLGWLTCLLFGVAFARACVFTVGLVLTLGVCPARACVFTVGLVLTLGVCPARACVFTVGLVLTLGVCPARACVFTVCLCWDLYVLTVGLILCPYYAHIMPRRSESEATLGLAALALEYFIELMNGRFIILERCKCVMHSVSLRLFRNSSATLVRNSSASSLWVFSFGGGSSFLKQAP
jgi:hypothetical protein